MCFLLKICKLTYETLIKMVKSYREEVARARDSPDCNRDAVSEGYALSGGEDGFGFGIALAEDNIVRDRQSKE